MNMIMNKPEEIVKESPIMPGPVEIPIEESTMIPTMMSNTEAPLEEFDPKDKVVCSDEITKKIEEMRDDKKLYGLTLYRKNGYTEVKRISLNTEQINLIKLQSLEGIMSIESEEITIMFNDLYGFILIQMEPEQKMPDMVITKKNKKRWWKK